MAKVGFWLKGAKGKLAGATVYQSNGETIMREVVKPTDAKTTGQVLQRIVMHTVMSSYSLMKEICDHSFEGIKKGQDTMSYFMKQNVQFCREKIATMQSQGTSAYEMYNFMPLGRKGFTPNQYLVSMGSLPQIQSYITDDSTEMGYLAGFSANTYQSVIDTLGLQRGDQLTFCIVRNTGTSLSNVEFKFCRVILDPTNADGSQAPLSSAFIVNGAINLPSARNEGNFFFAYNAENQVGFGVAENVGGMANFVIASRKGSDGTWLRSTSYMAYIDGANETYNLGECLDMAKEGASTPIVTTNDLYLNNAGTNAGAGGEGGTPVTPVDPTPTPSAATISSVSANGVNLTRGTQGAVVLEAGTTLPHQINVVVNTSNANGKKVAILGGNQFLAEATVTNGTATIAANVATGILYKVCWSEEEEYTETSFSFNVSVNTEGGGGNSSGGFDEG